MPTWQAACRGVVPSLPRQLTSGLSLSKRAISSALPFRAYSASLCPTISCIFFPWASSKITVTPASSGSMVTGTSEAARLASEPTLGLGVHTAAAGFTGGDPGDRDMRLGGARATAAGARSWQESKLRIARAINQVAGTEVCAKGAASRRGAAARMRRTSYVAKSHAYLYVQTGPSLRGRRSAGAQ